MIPEVTPTVAWNILESEQDVVLIDVRSKMEYDYVGHPTRAINIPWQEPPSWQIEPEFVEKVCEQLKELNPNKDKLEDLTLLTICRSGSRSAAAGEVLIDSGFKKVFNVVEGFEGDLDADQHRGTINGWRNHKLPWQQT